MSENQYLIDEDGDGKWDYIYDPAGAISKYIKQEGQPDSEIPIIYILLIIIVFVAIILIIKLSSRKKK